MSGYEHRASCDNCRGVKTRLLARVTLLGRWSEVGGAGQAEDREKKEIKLSALEKHRGDITPMQVYKMTCMGSAYRNFRS